MVLNVSIRVSAGFNHIGAPVGNKWAIKNLGLLKNEEIFINNQIGSPKERVNVRWHVTLNT